MKKLLALCIIPLMISSCVVSKKKYERLEFAKRRSDAKVVALDKENSKKKKQIKNLNSKLDLTLAEFNEMKNSMAESNAMKNTEIDELSTELIGLSSDTTALKSRLEETLGKYNRLMTENSNNEKQIAELKKQLSELKLEAGKLSQDLKTAGVNAEWEKKKQATANQKSAEALKAKNEEIAALMEQIKEKDGKLGWIRKEKKKLQEELEFMTNQRNLYKKQYEKATGGKK